MYRTPQGDPPPLDPWVIVPGRGVGPGIVGRSTAQEVLAWFGADAKVSRYDASGEIFSVDYNYENDDDYEPDRPAQARRPSEFRFEFGLLQAITIGVYQSGMETREGVCIGMLRRDVLDRLGSPSALIPEEDFETLRYVDLGIDVDIDRDDDEVMELTVFRPRW